LYLNGSKELMGYLQNLKVSQNEELMILVGEKSADSLEDIMSYLNTEGIKFFGGIYSRLLVGRESKAEGFIVKKYEPVYSASVLPYLMRFKTNLELGENYTAIVLVDGLSSKMKDLTDTIFGKLGTKVKYIGGGAGFYDLKQRPCIFNNNGLHQDILHVCIVKSEVKLAVRHGWKVLEGPFYVTESNVNVLSKLDEEDAFQVYKDVIEQEEHIVLYKEDFFTYAKDHPFGIAKKGDKELIVRDPVALNDYNEIVCVADVPQGSDAYILKGDIDSLLSSSMQIAEYCSANAPENYTPLLFNCISRAMFMEKRFEEELANIQGKLKYQVEGALSIGEIASKGNGDIVIHNKSTILGLLH
jgi:hypothetical protein